MLWAEIKLLQTWSTGHGLATESATWKGQRWLVRTLETGFDGGINGMACFWGDLDQGQAEPDPSSFCLARTTGCDFGGHDHLSGTCDLGGSHEIIPRTVLPRRGWCIARHNKFMILDQLPSTKNLDLNELETTLGHCEKKMARDFWFEYTNFHGLHCSILRGRHHVLWIWRNSREIARRSFDRSLAVMR